MKTTTVHMDNKRIIELVEGEEEKVMDAILSGSKGFITVTDNNAATFVLNIEHIVYVREGTRE